MKRKSENELKVMKDCDLNDREFKTTVIVTQKIQEILEKQFNVLISKINKK